MTGDDMTTRCLDAPTSTAPAGKPHKPWALSKKRTGRIVVAGLIGVVTGVVGVSTAAASSASTTATPAPTATSTPPGGSGGGARSGPATGGATGIVDTTSASGFTMTTATGVEVTVDETSATKTHGAPASAVKKGTSVLVLGMVDSATITAA